MVPLKMLGRFRISLPKMYSWFRICLPKMHGRFRIGLPEVHGRFRKVPPQVLTQSAPTRFPQLGNFGVPWLLCKQSKKINYLKYIGKYYLYRKKKKWISETNPQVNPFPC